MKFITEEIFLDRADALGRGKMDARIRQKYSSFDESIIGHSILSRPINGYFIGKGKKYIAILAAHHALEDITVNIAYMFIDYLLHNSYNGKINGTDCKLMLSKYQHLSHPHC